MFLSIWAIKKYSHHISSKKYRITMSPADGVKIHIPGPYTKYIHLQGISLVLTQTLYGWTFDTQEPSLEAIEVYISYCDRKSL